VQEAERSVFDFGLLHFAAHNIVASDLPASAYVKLDEPFQQSMLGPHLTSIFQKTAPLVFMNACNSGSASPLWVGSTGWAGRFLMAGASAFVGSLWQVRDGPALDFSTTFYRELKSGKTLGAAFQNARQQVNKPGDPTRLGYTMFGNPNATLAKH
jgi:CHAT domain-containing protein